MSGPCKVRICASHGFALASRPLSSDTARLPPRVGVPSLHGLLLSAPLDRPGPPPPTARPPASESGGPLASRRLLRDGWSDRPPNFSSTRTRTRRVFRFPIPEALRRPVRRRWRENRFRRRPRGLCAACGKFSTGKSVFRPWPPTRCPSGAESDGSSPTLGPARPLTPVSTRYDHPFAR